MDTSSYFWKHRLHMCLPTQALKFTFMAAHATHNFAFSLSVIEAINHCSEFEFWFVLSISLFNEILIIPLFLYRILNQKACLYSTNPMIFSSPTITEHQLYSSVVLLKYNLSNLFHSQGRCPVLS